MRMSTSENTKSITRPGRWETIPIVFTESPFYTDQDISLASSDVTELFERITPNSCGSKSEWKSFQHYKSVEAAPSSLGVVVRTGYWSNGWNHFGKAISSDPYCVYDGVFGAPGELDKGLPVFYNPGSPTGEFVPPPAELDSRLSQAIQAMVPQIRPTTSLVNSVIELKDFKSVPRTLKNCRNFVSMVRNAKRYNSKWTKLTFRELLRVSSDVYLQKKFNVDPLISDIKDIYQSLSRTERRLNALMSRAGRNQRSHFSRRFVEYTDSVDEDPEKGIGGYYPVGWTTNRPPILGMIQNTRYVYYVPSEFHVELEYSYNYAQYQTEHARLLGLLDTLGVNFNPAIIWNAIPWSFVVDWVFGVSRWLTENRIGLMDPALYIRRACWSIKRSRTIMVNRKIRPMVDYGPTYESTTTNPLPAVSQTSYRRQLLSIGDVHARLTASGLSSTELTLASALVFSRRSKHRRKR